MAYRPSHRLIISTVIILFVIGAFIVILPEIGRRAAVKQLERVFTVPVAIDDVDLNLFTGRAKIENLVIGNNESGPMLRLPAAAIEFSRTALITGQIDLAAMVLQNPQLLVERTGPYSYNVIEAVRLPDKTPQDDLNGGIAFSISRLQIESGQIVFVDHTQEPDYKLTLNSLNVAAGPISTLPQASATPTSFSAGIRIGDGSIRVAGSTKQLRQPEMVQLTAEISDVALQVFHVYLPYGGRLNVQDSVLNGQARYVITKSDGKTGAHYLDGELKIGGAGLMSAPPSRPILQVSGLAARDIHIDFRENRAVIGALAIAEPYLLVARDAAGFNFQQFSPISETPRASARGREDTADKKMSLIIKRVETENGAVEFVDQTVKPNVNSRFQDLHLVANELQVLPIVAAAKIEAEARLDNGSIRVTGNLSDQSSAGDFAIAGASLPFQPFRGYLDQLFSSANSRGERLSGELKLVFDPKKTGEGGVEITGNLQGEAMALRFPDQNDPFLTTQRLGVDLRSIRVGSDPRVDIDEIKFTGANLSIVRNRDGSLNLTRLWAASEKQNAEPAQQERASANETGTDVAIRLITIEKSDIGIVDRSVSPNYDTNLTRVNGKLTDLRPKARRAAVNLQGVLGDSANLSLSGWFIPFTNEPNMHLAGTIRSYALPPLNPYATQYVSHRIQRGQITMDVRYTLEEGQVEAAADVVLRQVRVGERTGDEFVRRIGIPLELAVALLEDINGVIRLQLAMSGDTELELDVPSLVWNAVRNAIVRAITAPFRLVGNILTLGGRIGGVRINPIRFEPGTQKIQAESAEQLDGLTEILREKPKLEFNIVGAASRGEIDALKQNQFWQMIDSTEAKGYQTALIQLYRQMGGIAKPATPLDPIAEESMERFVLDRIKVTEEELRELARGRAEIIKEQLVRRGIEPERLAAIARDNVADEPAVEIELVS
jgi:hypothetical protein